MVTTKAGQQKNKGGGNNNPTGKGGFAEHPELRNENGQRNSASVAFSRTLRELIVIIGEKEHSINLDGKTITKKNVEWMIESLWAKARSGKQDAIDFIAERIEGKVTQPIGGDPNKPLEIILKVQRDRTTNRTDDPSDTTPSEATGNKK